jgi:hypothetical protein
MRALPQALEFVFEVQKKRSNEKIARKKKSFPTYKMFFSFFFFLFLGPLLFLNLITFLFFIHFQRFKMLHEHHLKFYKSSFSSNSNITTYKEFFGCLGPASIAFNSFFLTPSILGVITFSILFRF